MSLHSNIITTIKNASKYQNMHSVYQEAKVFLIRRYEVELMHCITNHFDTFVVDTNTGVNESQNPMSFSAEALTNCKENKRRSRFGILNRVAPSSSQFCFRLNP